MNEHHVRLLEPSEFRDARDLFLSTVHRSPQTDGQWESVAPQFERGRSFGAFAEGELAGTTWSLPSSLRVPGGAAVPSAAVTSVGVRPDKTRRGILTSLMRAELRAVRERGEPLAMLHASEALIYGRFGYGVATRARNVSIRDSSARLRPDLSGGGGVRLVGRDTASSALPEIYDERWRHRPGMIGRTPGWWSHFWGADESLRVAVRSNRDGRDDGYVVYKAAQSDFRFGDGSCALQVRDLQAADPAAAVDLWRFVLGVDLVTEVVAPGRPPEEPLEWWLVDRRAVRVTGVEDDLWVRLVDVPAALAARAYGSAAPVVLEVEDGFLPENSGKYRVGPDGVAACTEPADLSLDASALASAYLGDVAVSTLAGSGLVEVHDRAALDRADELFTTRSAPWCGTGF